MLALLTAIVVSCNNQTSQDSQVDDQTNTAKVSTPKKKVTTPRFPSPAAELEQTVGLFTIKINYSRPSVISPQGIDRTGKIWGGLVPYDFDSRPVSSKGKPIPWRAGANENTVIEFSHDATIEGKPIKAGKYGLFMAIHEVDSATVIFSNKSDSWGSFSYDEKDDALRVEVNTVKISNTERLNYTVPKVDKTYAIIALDWEKKRIPFKVAFDVHGMVIADFQTYLSDTTGLKWRDYNKAASYCASNKVNMDEGMKWVERAITLEENYATLSTKSDLLNAMGKNEEAEEVKNMALQLSSTTANNFYSYGTSLIQSGMLDKAMEIFLEQSEKWPDDWLTAHGLARGYSAKGDYQKALKYEKEALTKAPEVNKGFIESAILLLEQCRDYN